MSERDLKLQVVFSMIEKITAPLKRIIGESTASGKALKALRDRLKDLDSQQKALSGFRQLHSGLQETANRLDAARQRAKMLAEQMQATEQPTRTMTREFERATKAAKLIKEQHQRETQQLQVLRDKLSAAGISTQQLAQHERSLRNNIADTNAQITSQQHKLSELAKRHEQVSAAKKKMESTRVTAGNATMSGMGMAMAGTAMSVPVMQSLGEAKHFETEIQRIRALGMGDAISNDAIKFSQAMQTYGTSSLENLELMRDSLTVFADLHHAQMVLPTLAKMKFANAAMYDEQTGAEKGQSFMNMLKVIELRGGLASEKKFEHEANLVQKVLTATGGRVGPDEWLNFIKTGGVAAKSLQDEAFFYKMEPLIQEMGGHRVGTGLMSAYANLYQGHTTVRAAQEMGRLDLLDPGKVEYNKIGMIKQIKPGALAGGEVLKSDPMAWLETVLLPKLVAKGITEPEQIKDTIATIMTNRTASNLFTQMYLQREQIHKNAKLNAGAADIDTLNRGAHATTKGRELEALAKISSAKQQIGTQILPLYASALEKLANVLQTVTTFMKEHSTTAKVLAISFAGLSALLVVLGTLTIVFASIIGPFALFRYGMTLLKIESAAAPGILARLGTAFLRLGPLAMRAGSFLLIAGRALVSFGIAALASPIGLIIAAVALLAAGAYLLYKNWEPVKAYFIGLWAQIRQSFNDGIAWLSALTSRFTEFGSNLVQGLINGIRNGMTAVKETITSLGSNVVDWFKEKLGIHSPSVVFTELGQFTMQGLSNGLANGEGQAVNQVSQLATRLTKMSSGLALTASIVPAMAAMPHATFDPLTASAPPTIRSYPAPTLPPLVSPRKAADQPAFNLTPLNVDRRPPVASNSTNAAPAMHSNDTIQITINPPAGTDAQAIAKAVAAELDKRERQRAATRRSSMHDYDDM